MKKYLLIISILPVLTVIASCMGEAPKVVDLDYPLEKIEIWREDYLLIEAAKGVCLSDLVDLNPFIAVGFWPGISFQQAGELHGPPDFKSRIREGRDEAYGYSTKNGIIEIIKQNIFSEGAETDRWFLRINLDGHAIFVDQSILAQAKYLQYRSKRARIKVFAGTKGGSVADLDFEGADIKYIWWKAQGSLEEGTNLSGFSCVDEKTPHRE